MRENKKGRPVMTKLRQEAEQHRIEEVGRQLREMMPWMRKQA